MRRANVKHKVSKNMNNGSKRKRSCINTGSLRIAKDTKEFIALLYTELKNFPRFEKYSIGSEMLKRTFYLIEDITKANREKEKRVAHLDDFLNDLEPIVMLLEICYESRAISVKTLHKLICSSVNLKTQATAWRSKMQRGEGNYTHEDENRRGQGFADNVYHSN